MHIWDLESGAETKFTPQSLDPASALAFLPDGQTLVAGFKGGDVRIFSDGRQVGGRLGGQSLAHLGQVRGILVLSDEDRLVTHSEGPRSTGGSLCLWSLSDKTLLRRSELAGLSAGQPLYAREHGLFVIPTRSGTVEVWAAD